MNLQTYVDRYLSILELACNNLPDHTTFPSGANSPYTHTVRLRQTRKYLLEHLSLIPLTLRTPEFVDKLRSLNFWYVDNTVYLGDRKTFGIEEHILTASTTSQHIPYNIISRPLTSDELQALFYCYNSGLFSVPTRLENQPDTNLLIIQKFAAACPNVGVAYNETSITLL